LVGRRPDISDLVYLADVKPTPGFSTIKKGEKLKLMLFDFILKSMGGRKPLGVPDGKDVNAFDSQNVKIQLQARGTVARRAPMVGFIAQMEAGSGMIAGVGNDLMADAVADQVTETKRDMEREMWSNSDSMPDDGVNGSRMRGLGRWIYDGVSTLTLNTALDSPVSATTGFNELPIPATYRTPSGQIYTGSIATMTEDQFGALIQSKYENTGASSELLGFVTPVIKNRIGFFSRYQPNVSNYTPNVYVTSGKLDGTTLIGATVDVYKSDWGTFRLMPVLTDFMPTAYTGFFLDNDHVRIRAGKMLEHMELPDLGGGPREVIQSVVSVIPGDPRAHCKIDGTA